MISTAKISSVWYVYQERGNDLGTKIVVSAFKANVRIRGDNHKKQYDEVKLKRSRHNSEDRPPRGHDPLSSRTPPGLIALSAAALVTEKMRSSDIEKRNNDDDWSRKRLARVIPAWAIHNIGIGTKPIT